KPEGFRDAATRDRQVRDRLPDLQLLHPGGRRRPLLAPVRRPQDPPAGDGADQHPGDVRQDPRGRSNDRRPAGGDRLRGRRPVRSLMNSSSIRRRVVLLALLLVPAAVRSWAADKNDAPASWPEITEQERALKSVPQDPEADAVILRRT